MKSALEFREQLNLIRELGIFDIVRIVDVKDKMVYSISDDGQLISEQKRCYAVWAKDGKCDNCISMKACSIKGKTSKFEVRGNDIYQVTAKYVELNGSDYVVEYVTKEDDTVILDAIGKEKLISTIMEENKKLYKDPLTNVYNRLFFEEQVKNMNVDAIAMIDIDDFKYINDTYGHSKGDEVLKSITSIIEKQIRSKDILIRLGGDEFLLVFPEIPDEVFSNRLEQIVQCVEKNVHFTISLGGLLTKSVDEASLMKVDELLYKAKQKKNTVVHE